jgi:hypothetical protein
MVKSDCFAITFKNDVGANPININGAIIPAGDALEVFQSEGHIDRTQYNVIFGTGGTGNSLTVTKIVPKNQPNEIGL